MEDPSGLWGRSAGAPRSLLSLSGPPCASAGAATQRGSYARPVGLSSLQVGPGSGGEHVAAEADGKDRTQAVDVLDRERIHVVRREVRVFARLQRPLLVLLMR